MEKKLLTIGLMFFVLSFPVILLSQGSFVTNSVLAAGETDKSQEKNNAAIVCGQGGVDLPGCKPGASGTTLPDVITRLIPGNIAFMGVYAVIMIMVAGIMYIVSLGNDEKEKKARKIIYFSIFGILIGMLAYILVQITLNLRFH